MTNSLNKGFVYIADFTDKLVVVRIKHKQRKVKIEVYFDEACVELNYSDWAYYSTGLTLIGNL
jgi:hypothetical protein